MVPSNIVLDRDPGYPTGREDLGIGLGSEPQSNFAFLRIAAKPLEITEWLLQTDRN